MVSSELGLVILNVCNLNLRSELQTLDYENPNLNA